MPYIPGAGMTSEDLSQQLRYWKLVQFIQYVNRTNEGVTYDDDDLFDQAKASHLLTSTGIPRAERIEKWIAERGLNNPNRWREPQVSWYRVIWYDSP